MKQNKEQEKRSILIVEDDMTNGEVLSLIITHETDCHPLVVTNADDALKIVQHNKPNLFILDYHLPGLNGIQLYNKLHAIAEFDVTPAIFLSASQIESMTEPLNVAFIEKPFELDALVHTIHKLLPPSCSLPPTPRAKDIGG